MQVQNGSHNIWAWVSHIRTYQDAVRLPFLKAGVLIYVAGIGFRINFIAKLCNSPLDLHKILINNEVIYN